MDPVSAAVPIAVLGLGCLLLAVVAWWLAKSRAKALKQRSEKEAGKDFKDLGKC